MSTGQKYVYPKLFLHGSEITRFKKRTDHFYAVFFLLTRYKKIYLLLCHNGKFLRKPIDTIIVMIIGKFTIFFTSRNFATLLFLCIMKYITSIFIEIWLILKLHIKEEGCRICRVITIFLIDQHSRSEIAWKIEQ